MLDKGIAGAAHGIPEQDAALGRIHGIGRGVLRQGQRRAGEQG